MTITAFRLKVLRVIMASEAAVTQAQISARLAGSLDRVTLYRILKSFEKKGLVHRVIDLDGVMNFALSAMSSNHGSFSQHLHFSCMRCKSVVCLDNPALPNVKLPASYEVHAIDMTVVGICSLCSKL